MTGYADTAPKLTDLAQRLTGEQVQVVGDRPGLVWSLAPVYWMLATSFKIGARGDPRHPDAGAGPPDARQLYRPRRAVAAVLLVLLQQRRQLPVDGGHRRRHRHAGGLRAVARALPHCAARSAIPSWSSACCRSSSCWRRSTCCSSTRTCSTASAGLVIGFTTFGLPFAVWMMKSFIDAVPIEVEEAARVDGYPRWQILLEGRDAADHAGPADDRRPSSSWKPGTTSSIR